MLAFVSYQLKNAPDFLRFPFFLLSLLFEFSKIGFGTLPFRAASEERRAQQILWWKNSRISFIHDFIRVQEALVVLAVSHRPFGPALLEAIRHEK